MRLTTCLNLPAPGRRQCLYVGLEYALADTCVFAKQSLGTILCGRSPLGLYGFTYCRHPFSRSYGVILPSSFSVNHSSPLGCSPRPPVSDYGTVNAGPGPRSFSWQHALAALYGALRPLRHRRSTNPADLPTGQRLPALRRNPPPAGDLAPASLLGLVTFQRRYGNVDPFPIAYAFRPRLRDRLTLS